MFSMFHDVLGSLHAYEKGWIQGLEVDFGSEGIYFNESRGPNWWCYYCEPIVLGEKKNIRVATYDNIKNIPKHGFWDSWKREFWTTRTEANILLNKYIRFLPHILEKMENFSNSYFTNSFVIGIHYRGTDWFPGNSYPRISYESFAQSVREIIKSTGNAEYLLFVATDEQPFLDFMKIEFPDHLCFQENAFRSKGQNAPIHLDPTYDPSKQGEEAILDSLLLSKAQIFIGTNSNLSRWVTILNPNIPVIDLSGRLRVLPD